MREELITKLQKHLIAIENLLEIEALQNVLDQVIDMQSQYLDILTSIEAENIFAQSYGKRFDRLQDARLKIWLKINILRKVTNILFEERRKLVRR